VRGRGIFQAFSESTLVEDEKDQWGQICIIDIVRKMAEHWAWRDH